MRHVIFAALAAFGTSMSTVDAHDFTQGALLIDHPMAFETAPNARAAAGYLTITNNGDAADRLISVEAAFPKVMLHGTEESDGVARMVHVDGIDIPAKGSVALEPGGMHIMFMGLSGHPFEAGKEVKATLVFEAAGEVDVVFHVEARGAGDTDAHDHSSHGAAVSN